MLLHKDGMQRVLTYKSFKLQILKQNIFWDLMVYLEFYRSTIWKVNIIRDNHIWMIMKFDIFRHIWNIKRQFLYTNLLNVIQDCSCKDVINIYYRLISLQPCHKKCDTSGGNGTRRSNDQKAKGLIQQSPLPKKERKHPENSSTQQV